MRAWSRREEGVRPCVEALAWKLGGKGWTLTPCMLSVHACRRGSSSVPWRPTGSPRLEPWLPSRGRTPCWPRGRRQLSRRREVRGRLACSPMHRQRHAGLLLLLLFFLLPLLQHLAHAAETPHSPCHPCRLDEDAAHAAAARGQAVPPGPSALAKHSAGPGDAGACPTAIRSFEPLHSSWFPLHLHALTPPLSCPCLCSRTQMQMMVQQLADAENRHAELEKENEGLKDQLATMQFQNDMPEVSAKCRSAAAAGGASHMHAASSRGRLHGTLRPLPAVGAWC